MKYCSKGGKEIMDETVICPECGCPQDSKANKKSSNSSLVWGIISVIAWLIPIAGLPCSIVGIVIGTKNTKKLGLYLSIIGLILTILNAVLGGIYGYQSSLK